MSEYYKCDECFDGVGPESHCWKCKRPLTHVWKEGGIHGGNIVNKSEQEMDYQVISEPRITSNQAADALIRMARDEAAKKWHLKK